MDAFKEENGYFVNFDTQRQDLKRKILTEWLKLKNRNTKLQIKEERNIRKKEKRKEKKKTQIPDKL